MTTASAASLKINLTWFTLTYAAKKTKGKWKLISHEQILAYYNSVNNTLK